MSQDKNNQVDKFVHPDQEANNDQDHTPELDDNEEAKDEEYYKRLMDEKLEEDLKHLSRPLLISKLIVKYPFIVLSITLLVYILFSVVIISTNGAEADITYYRDHLVWGHELVNNYDLMVLASEDVQTDYPDGLQPLRTSVENEFTTSILFDCGNCASIFTVDYIQKMYEIEQALINHPDFGSFCEATSSTDDSCSDESYQSFTKNFADVSTITQTDIDNELALISTDDDEYYANYYLFPETFSQSNTNSKMARSIFLFAKPIEFDGTRYKSFRHKVQDQAADFVDLSNDLEDIVKDYDGNPLDVNFYNVEWSKARMNEYTMDDFGLIIVSFTFVLIYVSFHLQSFFLSLSAMIGIALAYPLTTFIIRYIYQIDYFGMLNYTAVFIILGIAADNVFVFSDCWHQSKTYPALNDEDTKEKNMIKRMNYTWRRTCKAISTTSVTTFVSFLATGFSKIMPISAFGFFAGTLVLAVFSFAITAFPSCVIIYDKYLSKCCPYHRWIKNGCKKLFKKNSSKINDSRSVEKDASNSQNEGESSQPPITNIPRNISPPNLAVGTIGKNELQNSGKLPPIKGAQPIEDEKQQELSEIIANSVDEEANRPEPSVENTPKDENEQKFVAEIQELSIIEKFFGNQWNSWINKTKFISMPIILIWLGIALWRVSRLESATEAIKLLRDSHWLAELETTLADDFHKSENADSVTVYMVWGIDELDRDGVDKWDSTDIGKIKYDSNFDMSSETNQQRILDICNSLKTNSLVLNEKVTCWVQDFVDAQNGGSPVPQASFYTELETYIGTTTGQNQFNENLIGYISGKLKFMRISALSPEAPDAGYNDMYPVYEDWEDLKDFYNKGSPSGVNKAYQSAGYPWAWLATQEELIAGAIQGLLISMLFAFIVLMISTLNIMTALYSVICIACIIVSVICTMELCGWTLGVLEAVAMVIIVGFSVDYVVHLANHYVESVYEDKFRRMKDALTGIGISIVSGAITTIGSGIFMFLATILFFVKFAILILSTILFSLFFALVLFTSINHWIGPSGHCGDLKYYLVDPAMKRLKQCCKKNKESESAKDEEK